MPYISVESGALTAEQKKELIERLTATAAEIIHIPAQFFTVTIKELPDENFGIGGKSTKSSEIINLDLQIDG
jgi:4-oxalocrotonate tautomerase